MNNPLSFFECFNERLMTDVPSLNSQLKGISENSFQVIG